MPTDQEKFEQIERYLAGEMPEMEHTAFETALQQDPALAESLALHGALRQSLGNRQRRQLLDALADVVEQEAQKRPVGILKMLPPFQLAAAAAVLVLVAAVGAWWYLRPQAESPVVAERPSVPAQPGTDSARPVAPGAPATRPTPAGPLASADRRNLAANRALDPLAGTLMRGGNSNLTVSAPRNDAVLPLRNGKVYFHLEGHAGEMTTVALRIYNNSEADFAAGKFVYGADLPVENSIFICKNSLRLVPGRYYVVLTAPGEEEPLSVTRFFVGIRK